ncbi:hypothetical protein RDI58_002422 [Solanum bulbocastanum]|uniref:WRKY domain-containing protein n=1 Tax=Solanum bulbocastanum TaxID=147425 RepID=A0AAN8U9J3_SOLBU
MEKVKSMEKKKLINELTQGKEFVNQLKNQIIGPLASPEECDLLIGKILSTLEKSLSILNLKALLLEGGINNTNNSTASCSSISFLGSNNNISPKSEVFDSSRDQLDKNMVSKKRKKTQQWTNQTTISVNGLEGPCEDGFSWRKYGQKDILGANHPRAYYRCTHRNTQGCLATKQVQKSDGNSTIFEVTYKGRHSCKVGESEIFSLNKQKRQKCNKKQEMVIFNSASPNHNAENFDIVTAKEEVFTPFPFPPPAPLHIENVEENNKFFPDSMAPFPSPIASELPLYLSLLTSQNDEFGMEHMILQSSDSDLTELISTPTSISNSSFGGEGVDYEPEIAFDIEEFFI